MFSIAAETSATITPLIIALLGSGGFIGAIVALIKLKPDLNSSAVSRRRELWR